MSTESYKHNILRNYTSDSAVIDELITYTHNKFTEHRKDDSIAVINRHLSSFSDNLLDASEFSSVFEALKTNWVKFHFPIQKGISTHAEYKQVTLKGVTVEELTIASGLQLKAPEKLELSTYNSIAGSIALLIVPCDEDFKTIIRALCHQNEPAEIPDSMGAAMIKGIINWNRILSLKEDWRKTNTTGSWGEYFKNHILPYPDLYKDKVIVLSTKPYSNVKAEEFNLNEKDWIKHSINIRLFHECFHLFSLKQYGAMANNMHDELIADYYGIRSSIGSFNKEWLLKFIGLENYPSYRTGARLENYLGNPALSEEAFKILQTILKKAIDNLYVFDQTLGTTLSDTEMILILKTLCSIDLLTLSSTNGAELLASKYEKLLHTTYHRI